MNRPQCKIFGVGLSRTGTTSLSAALQLLGYQTLHFSLPIYAQQQKLFPHRHLETRVTKGWQANYLLRKEIKAACSQDATEILADYDAFCDLPFPLLFREFDVLYPNSKFILTTRPMEGWLKSMEWLLTDGSQLWNHGYLDRELLAEVYNTSGFQRDFLIDSWNQHHNRILHYFSERPEDFLLMDISNGDFNFQTLCSFLGVNPPKCEFPRSNESKQILERRAPSWIQRNFPLISHFARRISA